MENLDELKTYLNKNGLPILRHCKNCIFWKQELKTYDGKNNVGYCKFKPTFFAFTLEATVYFMTKDYYLCANHRFVNELMLEVLGEPVLLKDALKKKDEL